VIVARTSDGRVVADRTLDRQASYTCPLCETDVTLKAGPIVIAHFAHQPGADCVAAGESRAHLEAKKLIADQLSQYGWSVDLEHILSPQRRADLLVTSPNSGKRFTIEIQDSRITPDGMKIRERADRSHGCIATCWIFTDKRLSHMAWDDVIYNEAEVRLPDDIRYRWHATHVAIPLLRNRRLALVTPEAVSRDSNEWHDEYGDLQIADGRQLRATFTLKIAAATFRPSLLEDRYGRPAVSFVLADEWWEIQ
jgi:competence CoiA-like predicted nuclease